MKRLAVFLACVVTFTGMSSNAPVQAKVKSGTWWAIGIIAVGVAVYESQRHRHHEFVSPTNTSSAGATMGTSGTSTITPGMPYTSSGSTDNSMAPGTGSSGSSDMNKGASLRLTPSTSNTVTTARDRALALPGAYHLSYTPVSSRAPAARRLASLSL